MKLAKTLKERDLEAQIEALLRGLLGRVPCLNVKSFRHEVAETFGTQLDWTVEVQVGDRLWLLAVEAKRNGQPREVRNGLLHLQRFLNQDHDRPRYGIMVAPFLSPESARICEEGGIGYADLAGNARLSFDQVFIETRVADNPFREKREARSLFAPRATRVLRVLLQGPLRPWKVTPLAESARVSLGWVSAVRQQLLAREWAAEVPGGLLVKKPDAVLDSWARADDLGKRTRAQEYSVLQPDPEELARKLKDVLGDEPPVFTQWFAGALRHPYTTPVIVAAYVRQFPDDAFIKEKLLARRVSTGAGGLRLIVPKDEGVFNPSQTVQGFELVSDVQIYLDLQQAGLRGEEQAKELREWPDFSGGWA
jgi:hypothetical protein